MNHSTASFRSAYADFVNDPDQSHHVVPASHAPREVNACDKPLMAGEEEFLDRYSGTSPDPEALRAAVVWSRGALATTSMPDVPHIEAIRDALPGPKTKYEAVAVTAFVENGRISDPETDEEVTVRDWLESKRDPQPVLDLANSLRYGL